VLKKRPVVMGTHHPEGVFIGCGPGIRRGAEVDPLHLLDMAPTVLYALGLPIPEDLEGAVGSEMFTREHARTHAVRYGSTAARSMAPILDEVIDETANGGSGDDEEHEQILMRLKALGYMD
jgi:arylsulfatase A-like enzyme